MNERKKMVRRLWHEAVIRKYGAMMLKNRRSFVFISMANTCLRAGKNKMALDVLEQGLRHHPEMASALVLKGRALMALGRGTEAKRALSAALEKNPENVLSRKLLAQLCLETGEPERGMALLDEIRALWPAHEPAKKLYDELKAAIESGSKDAASRGEPQSPDKADRGAIETLERWLNNANRMLVKG